MTSSTPRQLAAASQAEDARLWERVARRDPEALYAIYDRHGAALYGLGEAMLRSSTDAAALVLAVFLEVWHKAGRFDAERGQFLGWLISLTRKHAIERQRDGHAAAAAADAGGPQPADGGATATEPAGGSAVPAYVRELRQATLRALDTLPEAQRGALGLAYFGGLSHAEIAERLETPPDAIRSRIRQGMTRLRDLLADFLATAAPVTPGESAPHADRFTELAADYALGQLDGEALADFERHLASGCAACVGELEAMDAVGDALALAAPAVPPPADLRRRVADAVAADLQEEVARAEQNAIQQAIAGTPVDRREPASLAPGAPLRPGQPHLEPTYQPTPAPWPPQRGAPPPPPPRRGLLARLLPAIAIVAVVAAGLAGYEVYRLHGQLAALRADLERVNGIRQEMARVNDVVAAPGLMLVELAGQPAAPEGRGRVLWSPGDRKAVLHAFGLPAPPAGRDYQLWVIEGQTPRSEGVFPVDAQGRAVHVLSEVPEPGAVAAFVVTLEPAGGAPQPTGDACLFGAVARPAR